jgi:hypothetical protein
MSNKKETPVSWLVEQFNLQAYAPHVEHALQMESLKQQKYDEMLAMLEWFAIKLDHVFNKGSVAEKKVIEAQKLINEAKEL